MITAKPGAGVSDSFRSPAYWAGTVNFNLRKPNFVIIHHTAQESCEKTIRTFIDKKREVSAHYVICRDGIVHHMLNDYFRAWHAGQSKWGSVTDINSGSIGIELDNNGSDTFPPAQLNALIALLGSLKSNYNIPVNNFIGHNDIAPGRKVDPNINFPWKLLADNGFGRWFGDTSGISIPEAFDPAIALRVIGYDASKYGESLQAFRQHYLQSSYSGEMLEAEKKVLYSLMQQFL